MKVPLNELPTQRTLSLSSDFVDDLVKEHPMRVALGDEAGLPGEGEVKLDLYAESDNVFARGSLSGWVELACSRCVEPLRHELGEDLMITFLPEGELPDDDEYELEDGEDPSEAEDTYGYEGEEIDLKPMLCERFLLAMPFAPLCRPDCKGLCTQCGANLNTSECGCDRKVLDPRLAALKDIKV